MDVAIHEAGQHEVALSVDDSGGSAAIFFDLVFGPNSKNFFSADGESLCPRLLRIHRVDSGIKDDCVGAFCRRLGGLQAGAERNDGGERKQAAQRETENVRGGQVSLYLRFSAPG